MIIALYILAGFILLTWGGDTLVRGAVDLARRLNVTPLVIGVVLVGFGTSLPELVTSVKASLAGAPDIATGNVIGSNLANILLILGVAAMIKPVVTPSATIKKDGYLLLLLTLVFTAALLWGDVSRAMGIVFILILAAYLLFTIRAGAPETLEAMAEEFESPPKSLLISGGFTLGGIALTILGAELLVTGAVDLARLMNISEAVIGLTIVAVGTSLPELITSVIAARKGHSDVALGNVLGSNIFNMFGILGVAATILPLKIAPDLLQRDLWLMLIATFALIFIARTQLKLSRGVGIAFLLSYIVYTYSLFNVTSF